MFIDIVEILKAQEEVHLGFQKLILFFRIYSKLLDVFNHLTKLKVTLKIQAIKVGDLNRF